MSRDTAHDCDVRVLFRCTIGEMVPAVPLIRPSGGPSGPAAALRAVVGVLAPPSCAACRAPMGEGLVCGACLRRMPWLRGHRCPRCALPRHRAGCPAAASAFDRAWAPLAYEGPARDLVRALKFDGALPVAGLMAAHLAANLPLDLRTGPEGLDEHPPHGVEVVAVPPHRGRLRRRGFDPAALLAAGLASRAGLPVSAPASGGRIGGGGRSGRGGARAGAPGGSRPSRPRHRRARRCSSTTSTPPARRSTSAPAR